MMTKDDIRNNKLQELCRGYLLRLRPLAAKFGLHGFVDDMVKANLENKCKGTREEVELLSRACDDERLTRVEVAKTLGKSYRKANEDMDFDRIKKLKHQGIYSKIGALLLGEELKVLNED